MNVNCIGITGTNGAGKSRLADKMRKSYYVGYYSVRAFLEKECEHREWPIDRDSLVLVANDLRQQFGPDYIMSCLAQKAVVVRGRNPFIIESIRCVGEIKYLSDTFRENFVLIGVDAEIEKRYERVLKREEETDKIDFETFCRHEAREMEQADPWKQNIRACLGRVTSEFLLQNNGTEKEFFQKILEIGKILNLPC